MSEQRGHVYHGRHVQAQPTRQAVKFMAATTIGGAFLAVSGLTATATVIGLIVATPILVLFSPVLVPAAIVLLLVTAGFLFSGGFGVAAVSALSWIFRYATGKHPMGADQLDYARMKITGTARDATNKAREYGQYVQHKAQEVTQGS